MVPFNPQPVDQLKTRFSIALQYVYDWEQGAKLTVKDSTLVHPVVFTEGPPADQVFDFEDGLRLIVTQDLEEEGKIFLHVSAGAQPGTHVMRRFSYTGREGQAVFKDLAMRRYKQISGDSERLFFDGFAKPSGVAHWRRRIIGDS